MQKIKMRDVKPGDVIRIRELNHTQDGATVVEILPSEGLNPELEYMHATLELQTPVGTRRHRTTHIVTNYPGVSDVELFGSLEPDGRFCVLT